MLIGWLSPNGVFYECDYWNHIDRDICEIRDFKDLGILEEEYDFLLQSQLIFLKKYVIIYM